MSVGEGRNVGSSDRIGSIPHAAGLPSPTESKMFPRAILLAPNGQPLLVPQPLVPVDRSMVSIASPYLTQASIFYAPQLFSPHHFAAMQQTTAQQFPQVPSLIQLPGNSPVPHSTTTVQNGFSESSVASCKGDRKEEATISLYAVKESVIVSNSSANIKDTNPNSIPGTPSIPIPSLSPLTPRTPSSPGTPQQTVPSPVNDDICVICSDRATGHHYGVTSCEGCKGFFKRSVQNKKVYSCRNLTQDCPVDKRHRNRCQFCRLQKCIKAGMLKEAVREDRTPGGKHKNSSFSPNSRIKSEPAAKQARTNSRSSSTSDRVDGVAPAKIPSRTFPPFIKELLRYEPPVDAQSTECQGCKLQDTGQKTFAHVTQQAEEQIKRNLEWFKCLPLLGDISENDKRILSGSAWIELMLINLTKQSLHLDNGVLLCPGQVLDFTTAEASGIGDIMHRVMQLTAKFKELNLDDAEFVCIKVIILLNPDVKGLFDQQLVERLQDKVHASLLEYNNNFHPNEPNRFGNILLRLPELRSIGTKSLERLFMLNLTGQIKASESLVELLHSSKR